MEQRKASLGSGLSDELRLIGVPNRPLAGSSIAVLDSKGHTKLVIDFGGSGRALSAPALRFNQKLVDEFPKHVASDVKLALGLLEVVSK